MAVVWIVLTIVGVALFGAFVLWAKRQIAGRDSVDDKKV